MHFSIFMSGYKQEYTMDEQIHIEVDFWVI
jgi:hypothetical protein